MSNQASTQYTIVDLTDNSIKNVYNYYAKGSSSTTAPADSKFTLAVPLITSEEPYLWNYEVIEYTHADASVSEKRVVGVYGQTGRGILGITEYYLAHANNTGVTTSTSGWTTNLASTNAIITESKRYLWNYEVINYSDGTNGTPSTPKVIGVYGQSGASASFWNIESSTDVIVRSFLGELTPDTITFVFNKIVGNTTTKTTAYYMIESYEGGDWVSIIPNRDTDDNGNIPALVLPSANQFNFDGVGNLGGDATKIRCSIYSSANGTTQYANKVISIVRDASDLNQEEVFNILTNNGNSEGFFRDDETGNIYINASYIQTSTSSVDKLFANNALVNKLILGENGYLSTNANRREFDDLTIYGTTFSADGIGGSGASGYWYANSNTGVMTMNNAVINGGSITVNDDQGHSIFQVDKNGVYFSGQGIGGVVADHLGEVNVRVEAIENTIDSTDLLNIIGHFAITAEGLSISGYDTTDQANTGFQTLLNSTELAFMDSGNKVAYISNQSYHIAQGEIGNSLSIGKYVFVKRKEGGMSLQWID